jgi:two-component system response regulator HydG
VGSPDFMLHPLADGAVYCRALPPVEHAAGCIPPAEADAYNAWIMANTPDEPLRVLVIDDEAAHAEVIAEGLVRVGFDCTVATSGQQGARQIENETFDLILTDLKMAGVDGLEIVRLAQARQPEAKVIVITGFGDVTSAVRAMKEGADHFLQKPIDLDQLRTIVAKSAEGIHRERDLKRQLDERFGLGGIIGNSPRMQQVITRIKQYAPTDSTVLILGENGTGKELVARALHNNSPRRHKPFVAMNCTALNENLLDDELFGHEPGAYTGADKLRQGRFEFAHGGTLFLDEIADMPLNLQAKLLRVLEVHEVVRLGSNTPIKTNVRLLSATNKDLEALIVRGKFRNDLYFRLKVGIIRLPPLRERGGDDIRLLSSAFLKQFNEKHGKNVARIGEELHRAFRDYAWPGNVRELRNLIESMVVQDSDRVLTLDDVEEGEPLRRLTPQAAASPANADGLVGRPLTDVMLYYVERALDQTKGNREEAARMLGIAERTLYRMMQEGKLQVRIREALAESAGDVAAAAAGLGLNPASLKRKMKKFGMREAAEAGPEAKAASPDGT